MCGEKRIGVMELFLEAGIGPAFGEVEIAKQRRERNRLIDAGKTIILRHDGAPVFRLRLSARKTPRER